MYIYICHPILENVQILVYKICIKHLYMVMQVHLFLPFYFIFLFTFYLSFDIYIYWYMVL